MSEHPEYLDELVMHIDLIDENMEEAKWIMKEGIYLRDDSVKQLPFCDIIIGYEDYGVPAELKHSKKQRGHARQQIESGRQYLESVGLDVPYGKFVLYPEFDYELIEF
ncbi:MAG: hypothetical protein ACOC5T_06370 [Elusimicrobiota bacterium]